MVKPLRHRQTKGAETDMLGLKPPRHTPTLPTPAVVATAEDIADPLTFAWQDQCRTTSNRLNGRRQRRGETD